MGTIQMRTFTSVRDFGAKLVELFKGPTILMTVFNVDAKFADKRIIRFANYLGNLLHGKAWRAENEGIAIDACCIVSEDRRRGDL